MSFRYQVRDENDKPLKARPISLDNEVQVGDVLELELGLNPAEYEVMDIQWQPPIQPSAFGRRRPPQQVPPKIVLRRIDSAK